MAADTKEKKDTKQTFKMKYEAKSSEPTFVIGLGTFNPGEIVTFDDPGEIKFAKHLIKTNQNFKEVKS